MDDPPPDDLRRMFQVFNEVAIIGQLATTMFEARLPKGVLVSHFALLNHLGKRDGQTPLAMANAFQVPKTTMSHGVAVLVKRGWVEMRANPRDGRSKTVWLTDAGRAFRDEAVGLLAPDLAALGDVLTTDRLDDLLPMLVELREYMDAQRDGANGSDG